MAQLDHVSVRVEHVETAPVAPCSAAPIRPADDVETPGGGHRVEIGRFDDEADVIDVLSGSLGLEEVDDRRLVEPQRREEDLAPPPLLDAQAFEPELTAIPREAPLDVGDVQDDVIEPDRLDHHSRTPSRGKPSSRSPMIVRCPSDLPPPIAP